MAIPALRITHTLGQEPNPETRLADIGADITAGNLIPFLGPELLGLEEEPKVPVTPEALAMELHAKVPVGAMLRGNMWGTAQYIEQRRHRKTLVAIMADIFKTPVKPGALHLWLARQKIPLIVDTWYDGALAQAFKDAGRTDWAQIQGVTRALEQRDVWTKCYAPDGKEISPDDAMAATTLIYKPHGSVSPANNFLVADSDYVEVLTEIDIQTPLPDAVKDRRLDRGFVFIGCRFHDQMLRTYARQIAKRSGGPKFVVLDFEPTRMEERFFAEQGIEPIVVPLADAVKAITAL
ncbi:MAG: SIR2 family protein [Hyphomicrobiaceae bacterium]